MENIRNFSIISHIDHGKSTLADRFLELTGTVPKEKMQAQFLDMMPLEREKGITIKMQPVHMEFKNYILNLIDTPGHVDFNYEVSRSLAAVEGVVLLVDASKGIQAQTVSNLELAQKQKLTIIPVINKIDLNQARTEEVSQELVNLLGIEKKEIINISAKMGTNIEKVLESIIKKIPSPKIETDKPLRALIFDSKYDLFKGVIAYVRVVEGEVKKGEKIYLLINKIKSEVKEIGIFKPHFFPVKELKSGDIGYIATGIKEPGKVRAGETITSFFASDSVKVLPGYKEPKSMVFASIYPENPNDFESLRDALNKLKLNDASLTFEPEMKESLGRGFRCGFLGSLHIEITSERLFREFGLKLIISTPSVVFKFIDKKNKEFLIYSPTDWPEQSEIKESFEPWVKLEVITPLIFLGKVLEILNNLDGKKIEEKYFGSNRLVLIYEVPLREIISGFYDNLKSISQGFASLNYEILGYRRANLTKLEILIAGRKEEAFSKIVPQDKSFKEGKRIVEKLKNIFPRQLFSVPLQAAVSGKIIARETVSAKRKDVIAPLYGGDYSRKKKLLERQKKGKKELKEKGQIRAPSKVFLEMFKS